VLLGKINETTTIELITAKQPATVYTPVGSNRTIPCSETCAAAFFALHAVKQTVDFANRLTDDFINCLIELFIDLLALS